MYRKRKTLFLLSLFIFLPFLNLPVTYTQYIPASVERPRVQYGYWEIVPVIKDLSRDWWVGVGTYYKDTNYVDTNSIQQIKTLTDDQIARGVWLIDPDGDNYLRNETRIGLDSGTARVAVQPPPDVVNYYQYISDPKSWGSQHPDEPTPEMPPDYWLYVHGDKNYCEYTLHSRLTNAPESYVTTIHRSAPPVGFAVGAVYPSTWNGIHWKRAGNGGYDNLTEALDDISTTITIPNYATGETYIYRQLYYSMKVTFWTQGVVKQQTKAQTDDYLMAYFYQPDGWPGCGCDGTYFVEDKSYKGRFEWLKESFVEAEPVIAGLSMTMEAPLWTSRATEMIQTPDGDYKAYYNNTWIGFLGAEVTDITGGHINPSVAPPTPERYLTNPLWQNTIDRGILRPAPESDEVIDKTLVTPAPDSEARRGTAVDTPPNPTAVSPTGTTNYDPVYDSSRYGGAYSVLLADYADLPIDAIWKGFPKVVSSGTLVQDPKFYEPYFLASLQGLGGQIGQLDPNWKNKYMAGTSQNFVDSYQDTYARPFEDGSSQTLVPLDYQKAEANPIRATELTHLTSIPRQYAPSLALSQDIPNELSFTLTSVLKPALHSWTTNITWVYKEVTDAVTSFATRTQEVTRRDIEHWTVLSGQEILNVYMTYTLTFALAVIDRYNHQIVPTTNFYSGEQLDPWVKTILHNNTYNEHYEWYGEFYKPGVSSLFPPLFWLLFGVFTVIFGYRGAKKRQAIAAEGGGRLPFMNAFISSLLGALFWGFLVTLLVMLLINFFTGSFPWNIL
ncbi:MAG: hypothetical protein ACTSRL_14380 [Candidatus Helarchaeota archaeon]|nr:hypothetical protein [Deltaproteobacteria bacterium]